ncbi:MAG: hypothetical protein LBL04_03650 [Bacteroidales bacterium]|jgi:long-subunit fatty acid transport protein|nr:hypothetical protein [Bacteroidales bacterium]
MKTRFAILLGMLAAATTAGNAQFFVEGSVHVSYSGSESEYHRPTDALLLSSSSSSSIGISPQAGYWLNDGIAVGVKVNLIRRTSKFTGPDPIDPEQEIERNYSTPEWRFSVFGRYKLWGTEKLSLLVDGSIGIGGNYTKDISGSSGKVEARSMIRINVFPMVSYDLTEKLSIIAACDFLSLSFTSETVKNLSTDNRSVSKASKVFGFNTRSTIFSSLTNMSIGFIYNF